MGKVLIQMAPDADAEIVPGSDKVFTWPAPPAKAQQADEAEKEASTAAPAQEDEPAAKPVFFCK